MFRKRRYIKLNEIDFNKKTNNLIIRKDSVIWLRKNSDNTTNIGLGSGTTGLFATSVRESIDEIIDLIGEKFDE